MPRIYCSTCSIISSKYKWGQCLTYLLWLTVAWNQAGACPSSMSTFYSAKSGVWWLTWTEFPEACDSQGTDGQTHTVNSSFYTFAFSSWGNSMLTADLCSNWQWGDPRDVTRVTFHVQTMVFVPSLWNFSTSRAEVAAAKLLRFTGCDRYRISKQRD